MVRGEMNRVDKEAPVVRMTSSAPHHRGRHVRGGQNSALLLPLLITISDASRSVKNGISTEGSLRTLNGVIYGLKSPLLLAREALRAETG